MVRCSVTPEDRISVKELKTRLMNPEVIWAVHFFNVSNFLRLVVPIWLLMRRNFGFLTS